MSDAPRDRVIYASVRLGRWMSAALDDPAVCAEMKADINEWFSAGEPVGLNLVSQIIAYDDLLRRYAGPLSTLCAGDVSEIDAAYDSLVANARALSASEIAELAPKDGVQ